MLDLYPTEITVMKTLFMKHIKLNENFLIERTEKLAVNILRYWGGFFSERPNLYK